MALDCWMSDKTMPECRWKVRELQEANEAFGKRQEWWNEKMLTLEAQRGALLEQRDELRRALEIIAVGDATNPQAQAAEELIALGYWRDIPEARAAIKTVEEKA